MEGVGVRLGVGLMVVVVVMVAVGVRLGVPGVGVEVGLLVSGLAVADTVGVPSRGAFRTAANPRQ
jgi:hypothetical protein